MERKSSKDCALDFFRYRGSKWRVLFRLRRAVAAELSQEIDSTANSPCSCRGRSTSTFSQFFFEPAFDGASDTLNTWGGGRVPASHHLKVTKSWPLLSHRSISFCTCLSSRSKKKQTSPTAPPAIPFTFQCRNDDFRLPASTRMLGWAPEAALPTTTRGPPLPVFLSSFSFDSRFLRCPFHFISTSFPLSVLLVSSWPSLSLSLLL